MKIIQLSIKNMVCPRCVRVVREELSKLGLNVREVELGKADVESGDQPIDYEAIDRVLQDNGFALLKGRDEQLVEQIKTNLIEYISELERNEQVMKPSEYLAGKLGYSYDYLSKLFSRFENMNIEKYLIYLKIERIKELLSYDELTLSEIAYRLKYSSVQHVSNQFKKVTGLTVREYKERPFTHRHYLDSLP